MKPISYARHRFLPDVIRHAVWLYLRFTLSYRDVEDLLAERGLIVSNEAIRRWVLKFGPAISKNLKAHRPKAFTRWHLDEMGHWQINRHLASARSPMPMSFLMITVTATFLDFRVRMRGCLLGSLPKDALDAVPGGSCIPRQVPAFDPYRCRSPYRGISP